MVRDRYKRSQGKKKDEIPVIIRYEGKGRADRPDWHVSDIVAVFPDQLGSVTDPRSMVCYSTIGQHGQCSAGYIGDKTKLATAEQIKAMLQELHNVGYQNLRVVSRASASHAATRRAEWKNR